MPGNSSQCGKFGHCWVLFMLDEISNLVGVPWCLLACSLLPLCVVFRRPNFAVLFEWVRVTPIFKSGTQGLERRLSD